MRRDGVPPVTIHRIHRSQLSYKQLLMVASESHLEKQICPPHVLVANAQANVKVDAIAVRALVRERLNEQLREQYTYVSHQPCN